MKKKILLFLCLFTVISCGSTKTFQSFFNAHKNDIGATTFQVPSFMRTMLTAFSPEMNGLFDNLSDFKFMTFTDVSKTKQTELIEHINRITASNYKDIIRENSLDKTTLFSIVEKENTVHKIIVLTSSFSKTSVFYLEGHFDPNVLRTISKTNQFEQLSQKLLQSYEFPTNTGFNPKR